MVGFELNSNVQYDMVIKKKFAKYVIDNKARLIERKPGVSIDNEKSKSIFAQAFQCSIQNVQQIFQQKVQIQFKEKTSPESFVKMDISVCKDNGSLSFSLIFEDSLMQYLPELNNDNYKNLFVSFASTTVDNFLFLQFANTNLQIRTLMINCEDDVERVFQEKSFYSLPTPLPSSWTRFKILIPGKEDRDIVNDNATLDEKLLISFCNSLKNLKFQKENYHSYEMAIENKVFDLYFHESNLERIRHLKEQKIQSFENFDKDLYMIKGATGETIAVKEIVINFEEIPRTILTCSSFLVDRANQSFLQDNGLMIEKMKIEQGRTQDSISIVCPFPQCKDRIVPNSEKYSAISHFLSHQDFRRVVSGQVKRHQDRKGKLPNLCPFENCNFNTWEASEMETHYGGFHRVGHIVFLQFSKANKWDTNPFVSCGILNEHILTLVQCSHCYEVMTRPQLTTHIQELRNNQQMV